MDTSALTTLVPAGGLGTILLILVGYLLRQIPADRADYRVDLANERERTATAERRTAVAIERAELAQLQVDEERRKRREAEAVAAAAETTAATQQVLLTWYAAERDRLSRYRPADIHPDALPAGPREQEAPP